MKNHDFYIFQGFCVKSPVFATCLMNCRKAFIGLLKTSLLYQGDNMDKRWALILLIVTAFLVVGCSNQVQPAPQNEVVPKETAVQPQQPVQEQVQAPVETATEPAAQETTPEDSNAYNFEQLPIDEQRKIKFVRTLLKSARDSNENYFFRYSGQGVLQTDVWVKGNIEKRAIIRIDEVDTFHTYNMVYMDRTTKKAEGYCETRKAVCPKGPGPFPESYSKWYVKTPKDWTVELGDDFYWALDNKIADVLYHIIDYRENGKTTRVYVRDYKGLPGRVEVYGTTNPDSIIQGKGMLEQYIYDDMNIGGVSDDEITPGGVIHS